MNFKRVLPILAACAFAWSLQAAPFYDVTDPYMAEYEGFWTAKSGAKGRVTAQIRPVSNNHYEGFVLLSRAKGTVAVFNLGKAAAEKEGIKFTGTPPREAGGDLLAQSETVCELRQGKLSGSFKGELGEGTFEASRNARKSPTLGAKPPKYAVTLNDAAAWEDFGWSITPEGALQVGRGNLRAKEKISSYKLHLEFRTPYLPAESGQARGNSGVYLQGKYEVQVLDSFGLYPLRDNDCGGIYQVRAPRANACLPPMQWQTFDITYIDGSAGKPPIITVIHNGVTVIERAHVPAQFVDKGTGGGEPEGGFLLLQNHGNPVQFRNIWAMPILAAAKLR